MRRAYDLGAVATKDGAGDPPSRPRVSHPSARPFPTWSSRARGEGLDAPNLLLADADPAMREVLLPWLGNFADRIEQATDGTALERALLSGTRYHLVIANARLPEPSALQVLARVRRQGVATPFIVVTSIHGNMLRVFVSDSEGTVLSSRMLDGPNLSSLITNMLGAR